MLGVDFRDSTEAVAGGAAVDIEFFEGVPKGALSWLLFVAVGANNSIGGSAIDRYISRLDSDEWLDITANEMRAIFDFVYSRFGGVIPATADLTWGIPLELLALLIPGMGTVGLPSNVEKDVMVRLNANASAGSIQLGWKFAASEPDYMPYFVGKTISGLAAATNDERFEINLQPFPTAGFVIDLGATEFTRVRIFAADPQGRTTEVTDLLRDHILMMHQPFDEAGLTDPILIYFDKPIIFERGSYILFNTGAGYNGTQRMVPLQFVPLKKAESKATA